MPIIPHSFGAIPAELRELKRWACWQESAKGKSPIQATDEFTGRHVYAKCDEPMTWADFQTAVGYWRKHLRNAGQLSGISFALNGDGIIGIDLDDCRNPKNKSISAWAVKIIERFASYTESSPSGEGIRIFLRGKLPPGHRCKSGKIEVYSDKRFLSVTGRKITSHGAGDGIEDRTDELLAWYAEVFGDSNGHTSTKKIDGLVLNDPPTIDDGKLAQLFRDKPKARLTYEGKKRYASQSEADLALANFAVNAGWPDQDVCDLLVVTRQNANAEHDKPLDYYARTIAKARETHQEQNRKSHKGGAVSGGAGIKPITIQEARKVFQRWLHLPNPYIVDVVLSVPAGNTLLDTDPLWLFLKGPPGSGKTELLTALLDHPSSVFVSNLTPPALISGYDDPKGGDPSLLPLLNGKTLTLKDFTTILEMNPVARDEIFGILRDVYDGYASKNFGTGRRAYKSRFNLLAGVTSAIESAWHKSQLGERFLSWAMDTDPMQQARRAMAKANHEEEMRQELRIAAAGVLAGIPKVIPEIPETLQEKTLTLAYLLARLRTYVARDHRDVVHRAPEVEVPTRITKQLLRLGQSVALVRRQGRVLDGEFAIMRKVALDSVPSARKAVFNVLLSLKAENKVAPAEYFAKQCRISKTPAKRHLDDLLLLGMVHKEMNMNRLNYGLTDTVYQEWLDLER